MNASQLYTREVIDLKFDEIRTHLMEQDKKLDLILVQTTAHNGRMKKIETIQVGYRYSAITAGIFMGVILSMGSYIYIHGQDSIQAEITTLTATKDTLSNAITTKANE